MDIFSIGKSRLRKDLLTLYFANPNQKYYLRELERILGYSVANIRRELIKLKKTGLFLSKNKGNLVYYGLNQSYHLFNELKSIVSKTSGIPKLLREVLINFKGITSAFIYGSFVESEGNEGGEVDLLIIGEVDEDRLIGEINKLEKKIQREINYYIYEKEGFDRKKEADHSFISKIYEVEKIFLIGDENKL